MDLKSYYQKVKEIAATMSEEHVIVVSKATSDGGKAGVRTEVTRAIAAKMIVDDRARLATPDETEAYRAELREAKQQMDQALAAARLQVTVISDAELRALRERAKSKG